MNNQSVTQPGSCNEASLYLGVASAALAVCASALTMFASALAVCATALWCALLCAWVALVKYGQADIEQTTIDDVVSQRDALPLSVGTRS